MTAQLNGEWYTTRDAAEFLRLQPDTVRRYAHRGQIKVGRRIGINLLFRLEDLEDFASKPRNLGRPKSKPD